MIRYVVHGLLLFLCLVFEYGFLHALETPWQLAPLCLAIGVYFVFTLRPDLGLLWFVGIGFAADIHAMHPVGETLIGAIVGGLLIYVVQQHISHSSLYSVMVLGGGAALVWLILLQLARRLFGVSDGVGFVMMLSEVLFAVVLSAILLLLIPWVQKRIGAYIRLNT